MWEIGDKSLGGAQYFLTFTDDKSKYSWVYILKSKDEVFDRFLEWKALVERTTRKKLKTLRIDNGGENTSTKFENYLKADGIRHELTVPKTPQQNGVAERLNRTLVEMARSMLLDAKLPKRFWAEAVSTAVYLKNRTSSKPLQDMTPYEAWHGRKPSVRHLRVFDAHIPRDERTKFDSKARKCIFLGYGQVTKGYRHYDLIRQKIIYSRDIQFNESLKGTENNRVEAKNGNSYQLLDDFAEDDEIEAEPQSDAATDGDASEPQVAVRRSTRETRPPC